MDQTLKKFVQLRSSKFSQYQPTLSMKWVWSEFSLTLFPLRNLIIIMLQSLGFI